MPPAAMTELILNFAWAAIALTAFALAPRNRRALAAVACLVALLFPIVSVSDDLNLDAATLYELLAAVLAAVAIIIALVAMARVFFESRVVPAFALVVHADPRSPPRR